MKRFIAAGIAALSFGVSNVAMADVIFMATRNGYFEVRGKHRELIPLDDNDGTTLSFNTDRTGSMMLTFSTNCFAHGDVDGFLKIRVYVDGRLASPNDRSPEGGVVLCPNTPGDGELPSSSGVRVLEVHPKSGQTTHTIQIYGEGENSNLWGVTDSFLSITQ